MIADIPGARIWYEDTGGSGPPVVLLHARTGCAAMWRGQLAVFSAAGYRCIAYDRRQSGRTEVAPDSPPALPADDLLALLERLSVARCHVIGTAAGGIVAFDYALTFREHVRSLVIANSIGGVQDESYLALGRRLRPMPEFDRMPPEFRELGPSYRAANAEGTARWMELEHQSRPARPLPSPQTNRQRLTFALLETIKVPTLLITGDADLYCPPAVLRLFAAHMPPAETRIVPETGHSAYWEHPDEFNRAILTFVAKH